MIGELPELAGVLVETRASRDRTRRVDVWVDPSSAVWAVQMSHRQRRLRGWRTHPALSASPSTLDAVWVHQTVAPWSGAGARSAAEAIAGEDLPWRLVRTREFELSWKRGEPERRVRVEAWVDDLGRAQAQAQQAYIMRWRPCSETNAGRVLRFGVADIEVLGERRPRALWSGQAGVRFPRHVQVRTAFEWVGARVAGGRRPLRLELLRGRRFRVRTAELDCMEMVEGSGSRREGRVWCTWPDDSELTRDLRATNEPEAWQEIYHQIEAVARGDWRLP